MDKGVVEIKSYYPRFIHVRESCTTYFRKVGKLHRYENTSKTVFGKPFWKSFFFFFWGKHFWVLKIVYQDIVKAIFKKKVPEANANFNVFESQCPKIRILSKALKVKLSKCPEWSCQFVDASGLLNHPSRRHSRTFHLSRPWWERWYGMEVCCTSGVWLEYESILWKLPRVSEVATNHWIFLCVIGHLTLFDFITNPRLRKRSFLLI